MLESSIIFNIGDKAVYPAQGVTEIVAMEDRTIGDAHASVYILKVLETGNKIIVPTNKTQAVGLRELVSQKEISELFELLRGQHGPRDSQTWNRRHREYTDKLRSGDPFEIAEVIRDLASLQSDKQLSFGERKLLKSAVDMLSKEIAIARNTTPNEVAEEISSIFVAAA